MLYEYEYEYELPVHETGIRTWCALVFVAMPAAVLIKIGNYKANSRVEHKSPVPRLSTMPQLLINQFKISFTLYFD